MRIVGFGARLVAALLACAPLAARAAEPVTLHLQYAVTVHGMHALGLDAAVTFDGDRYTVTSATHPAGFLGTFLSTRVSSRAYGTIANGSAHPEAYSSGGFSRGADRHVAIDYRDSDPVVRILTPPEPKRDPVAASATVGTVDTLSAVAGLLDRLQTTGRCDGTTRVFDGARLSVVTVRTAGTVTVPASERSPYAGHALECDFTSMQIGGFLHDDHFEAAHRPQGGRAMFAIVVPGAPPVAIRASFSSVDHGEIGLFLTKAGP